jgi:hypothetical protein
MQYLTSNPVPVKLQQLQLILKKIYIIHSLVIKVCDNCAWLDTYTKCECHSLLLSLVNYLAKKEGKDFVAGA